MEDKYKIIDGAPIPAAKQGGRRIFKYPLRLLEVGQCFAIEDSERHNVASHAAHYAKRSGKKFVVRRQDSGEHAGKVCCFRVE
jgi:hypothetical protein